MNVPLECFIKGGPKINHLISIWKELTLHMYTVVKRMGGSGEHDQDGFLCIEIEVTGLAQDTRRPSMACIFFDHVVGVRAPNEGAAVICIPVADDSVLIDDVDSRVESN